jgi:hypothetical protein
MSEQAKSPMRSPDLEIQAPQVSLIRVVVKALLLFLLLNLVYALLQPQAALGRLSLYNRLFPGRTRLPYGDVPERSYNLSLFNLEAMLASHEIAAASKAPDEYRVLLIGDSSTWGFLLPPQETLSAQLNRLELALPDGRRVRAYNLGYPVMSLTKDLLLLSSGMRYDPDLVIWLHTLESFPRDKQLFPPLLQQNPQPVRALIERYDLPLHAEAEALVRPDFWQRTLLGDRRNLADLFRLQAYGVLWSATGIDQDIPASYTPVTSDLEADESFHELQPPHLQASDLALEVIAAGIQAAQDVPILLVNEPMFISQGKNSHIRYNFYYPRWAYDDYRSLVQSASQQSGWYYLDLWDLVPPQEFTNSAVHLSPEGTRLLAEHLAPEILNIAAFEIP